VNFPRRIQKVRSICQNEDGFRSAGVSPAILQFA
jgi:hypothetical protein